MNHMVSTIPGTLTFDGALHWCVWLAIGVFVIGLIWVSLRVLLPLHRLVRMTRELSDTHIPAFDQKVGGIPEIERLRVSLQLMSEQIRAGQMREAAFRNSLAESQEHERNRIAREIHDDTIQSLVVVAHSLEHAATSAGPESPAQFHLKNARQQLIAAINGLRDLIAGLRPTVLDELGIAAALESLCAQHPHVEFVVVGASRPIESAHELALYRTAQEALRNAERYAHAQRIAVTLTYNSDSVILDIRDDGVGFEVPSQLREFAATGHFGLLGTRERLLNLGGTFGVSSDRQQGTHLRAAFPEGLEPATA